MKRTTTTKQTNSSTKQQFNQFEIERILKMSRYSKSFNQKITNGISFCAEDMYDLNVTYSAQIFKPTKKAPTLSDTKGGNMKRSIISKREYIARYAYKTFTINNVFAEVKRQKAKFKILISLDIHLFNGEAGGYGEGNDSFAVLKCENDGKTWEKGSLSNFGAKPCFLAYLMVPAISNNQRKSDAEKYGRFNSNAVYAAFRNQSFMSALKCQYTDFGANLSSREPKPFVVITARIEDICEYHSTDGTYEKNDPPATNFSQRYGRRPDFLFDQDLCHELMLQICEAASPEVPKEVKDWCKEKFPSNLNNVVPIYLEENGESEEVEKNESYAVYDIETGDIFDKKFYSGKSKNLVIFSKADNKFLEELSLGQKTRGVTISCITDKKGINAVLSDDEGKRKSNMNSIKKKIGVPLDKSIPLIHLDINPLNGIRIYDEDLNLDEPSRAVMVVTTKKWQLGIVQDVPAKIRCRKSTDLNEQKENEKSSSLSLNGPDEDPNAYCFRDPRIPVQYDSIKKQTRLNLNYPPFTMAYKHPDSQGSKTHKMLFSVYKMIHSISHAFHSTIQDNDIDVKNQPLAEHLDDSGVPIYDDNNYDYILNCTLNKFIAESDEIQKVFKEVEEIRGKEIRDSDLEI